MSIFFSYGFLVLLIPQGYQIPWFGKLLRDTGYPGLVNCFGIPDSLV
jgi:hypothetical protein